MSPEQALQIAEHQRRRFNELVDVFDTSQPAGVMARLQEIVSAAGLASGEIVLDVGAARECSSLSLRPVIPPKYGPAIWPKRCWSE